MPPFPDSPAARQDRPRFTTELAAPFFGIGLPNVAVSPELVQWEVNLALYGQRSADLIPGSELKPCDTGHGVVIAEKERLNGDLLDVIRR